MEQHRVVVRAPLSFWLYIVVALICAGAALWVVIVPEARNYFAEVLPIPLLVIAIGWVTLGWPAVVFEPDRVLVRNPLATWDVPVAQIASTTTTRGFSLTALDGQQIVAWAAPPPDRLAAWRARDAALGYAHDPRLGRLADSDGRPTILTSQAPGSASGDAAMIVEHQRRRSEQEATEPAPVRRRWNAANLALLALVPIALFAVAQLR